MTTLLLIVTAFVSFQATQPVDAGDPVDGLLQKMHDAGADLRTLSAAVELEDFDSISQANPVRLGTLALRRGETGGEGVAFHVVFNARRDGVDGPARREKIEYLLVGDELVDRNYAAKTQVSRKLAEEQAQRDLLKLGEGPFPLPIGQPVEEVRAQFDVLEIDPADKNLNPWNVEAIEGTRRLRLTPKAGSSLAKEFLFIDVDVDPATGMPRQVTTVDKAETSLRIARLSDIQVNANLEDAFVLEDVDLSDWNVTVEAMR